MKKLSILLSMLMIVGMFGTVASAAGTTDATITLTPDKTTVKVDDVITVTVALTADSEGMGFQSTAKIAPQWDPEYFEYVEDSVEVDSSTNADGSLAAEVTKVSTQALASYNCLIFSQKVGTSETRIAGDFQFGTFQLKALKEGSTDLHLYASQTGITMNLIEGGTNNTKATVDEDTTVAITIEAAGPVGPTTETVGASKLENAQAGADEVYIEDSVSADAYYAEGKFTQGKSTAYWTAKFGGVDKKYELKNIGNLSGNVKLGIVILGATDVTDLKLNVVTEN